MKSIPSTGFFFQLLHVFSPVDIRSINIRTFNGGGSSCLFLFSLFFQLLGAHENNYYRLYDDDYFYTEIRNGLNALVSLNVNNFLDALRELRTFCSRTHRPTSAPLCGPCEITKNYLDKVNNDVYAFPFYFYYD